MDVKPSSPSIANTDSETTEEQAQQMTLPGSAPFGPSTWNKLYYFCIAATAFVGLGTILNGGNWIDVLVRMFVTLLGGSMLVMAFITFVVVPLHVRHYENVAAAQKAARLAARAREEQEREAKRNPGGRGNQGQIEDPSFPSEWEKLADAGRSERSHDDQAASLRRMAADVR